MTIDRESGRHLALVLCDVELRDRHRWYRARELWIQDVEQCAGDVGKLAVDLVLQASGEKGERFDESFDVWIGALVVSQLESLRDFRITLGEHASHASQVSQLRLVVLQEFFVAIGYHAIPPFH